MSKLLRHGGAQEKLAIVPYIPASNFGVSSGKKMVALVVSERVLLLQMCYIFTEIPLYSLNEIPRSSKIRHEH